MASSTYDAARTRASSARARRDAQLVSRRVELWKANYEVDGSRKLWKAARRPGIDIGRDQTRRLMRTAGIQSAGRSRRVRTTRRDQTAGRHPDLVGRQFTATGPNRLWVTDLTFVATWAGVAYRVLHRRRVLADDRRLACRLAHAHPIVLDAIEMARWASGTHHEDLRCHKDAGSQGSSPRSATANGWRRSARPRRSGPSATRSITRWPRPSTATTRPS